MNENEKVFLPKAIDVVATIVVLGVGVITVDCPSLIVVNEKEKDGSNVDVAVVVDSTIVVSEGDNNADVDDNKDIMSEIDDDIVGNDGDGVILDGVGKLGELVCKLDEEEITSKVDDDIIKGDDERTVLDGVGEFGELVCKLDNEDIIFELDDDIIGDDDDNDKDDTRVLVITDVVVVLSNIHSLGQSGSLLGI